MEALAWDGKAIFCIIVMSLLAILVIAGTAYDMLVVHKVHQEVQREPNMEETEALISNSIPNEESHNTSVPNEESHNNSIANEESLTTKHHSYGSSSGLLAGIPSRGEDGHLMTKNIEETTEIGKAGQLLVAFSVYTNGPKILSTKKSAGTLGVLNGIRFISMSWVILGHSFGFSLLNTVNTMPYINERVQTLSFLAILNAALSVDTFFALSGLLVSYLNLKQLHKVGGVKNFGWGMFYFHRFWRLTPPYMLVMLLYVTTNKYWSNGPFWNQQGMETDDCSASWWKSLLYINNFYPSEETCLAWTWYLANDMQFYIISPLFLIPLYTKGFIGVCILALLVSFIATGMISSMNNLPMTLFGGGGGGIPQMGDYLDKMYVRPYCRIGPYIVGMLFGYLLYKTECKPRMTKWINLLGWFVAAGCCLSVLYANYGTVSGKQISGKHIVALYSALHTTVWGLGVCWVIYACATGYGGPINKFLSWSVFIPLSRLTYIAYLIHPVIILVFKFTQLQPTFLTDYDIAYQFIGHLVFANAGAFVLSLVFEAPFMGIEKVLLKRERKH